MYQVSSTPWVPCSCSVLGLLIVASLPQYARQAILTASSRVDQLRMPVVTAAANSHHSCQWPRFAVAAGRRQLRLSPPCPHCNYPTVHMKSLHKSLHERQSHCYASPQPLSSCVPSSIRYLCFLHPKHKSSPSNACCQRSSPFFKRRYPPAVAGQGRGSTAHAALARSASHSSRDAYLLVRAPCSSNRPAESRLLLVLVD